MIPEGTLLATEDGRNLKGTAKREVLDATFGARGYEYLGDHGVDRAVWEGAGRIACVGVSDAEARRLERHAPVVRRFDAPGSGPRTWLRALRVHQWVKNVLLFVPLLAAHRAHEPALVAVTLLAFLAFSLCASGVYLLNDLMDLEADRQHPTKRRRPLAAPVLVAVALGGSAQRRPWGFVGALAGYLVLNGIYTFVLKQVAIADVIFLASLYSLRVLAGGLATGIPVSPWRPARRPRRCWWAPRWRARRCCCPPPSSARCWRTSSSTGCTPSRSSRWRSPT
ncbi:MAG: UbiA family prenyltransferase [Myxococcota bacterium]|nr:UbiA family prenyltransferase [Myxococcota bacterium]